MSDLSKGISALAICTAWMSVPVTALAAECPADFPSDPINLVVGFGAGGGTDGIARAVASAVEAQQGWSIVIDNQPGAGGGVMSAALKDAEPDGYTIGAAGTDTVGIVPYTSPDASFTYEDFDYIASAMQINLGLVAVTDAPYDDLEEFVEYARESGRATVSVAGINQEVAIEQIAEHYEVNIIPVPGDGAADALQSALGGHVDATTQGSQHVQQIMAGDMKQLASMTDKRVPYAPDSPTLMESGLDINLQAHTMFFAPSGLDADVHTCLSEAFDEAVQSDSYAELMENLNNEALNLGPEALEEVVATTANYYEDILSQE